MARIFISHSSRDNEAARRLFAWLGDQGFAHTFLDIDKDSGIQPGAEWERKLYFEIDRCQAVVVLLTSNWLESKWCFAEFAQARALGKAIFPVIDAPSGERLVGNDLQVTDLLADREGGLERLSRAITEIALQSPDGFDLPKGASPFPGLSAFDKQDAAVFFGRDDVLIRLIETLRRRLTRGGEKFIAILGASGSGKSSVLRAGLLPRLERDRENWIVLPPFRPQLDPHSRLVDNLIASLPDQEHADELARALEGSAPTKSLMTIARQLRRAHRAPDAQIIVPIDQAEELFSLADRDSANAFWTLLSTMLDDSLPFVAVATMRSDYLGELQSTKSLTVAHHAFSLEPMPLDRVELLVRGPARVAGLKVDDRLIAALRTDAQTSDALPLIAFTLRKLYERHDIQADLTWHEYESLGDRSAGLNPLENAVRIAAEEALPASMRTAAKERELRETIIPALVRVNLDGQFVSRPAAWEDVPDGARPMIDKLIEARLLVRRGGDAGDDGAMIEVAHEALFRVWPRLAEWLELEREYLIGRGRLEIALADWNALPSDERDKGLLTGILLHRARAWMVEHPERLRAAEREFIDASISREQRRIDELESLKLAADRALYDARVARSMFLADLSRQRLSEARIGDAMSFAHLGAAVDDPEWPKVPMALNALSLAVQSYRAALVRPRTGFVGHQGTVRGGIYTADDGRVLTWSHDGTAKIWDVASGACLHTLTHDAAITGACFFANDRRVLTWSFDHTARTWDSETGALLLTLLHGDGLVGACLSASGEKVLTWSFDGTARLWSSETGERRGWLAHDGPLRGAIFSADGAQVITWSYDKSVRVWNVTDESMAYSIRHDEDVRDVVLLADPPRLLSWSYDKSIRMSDASDGTELYRITLPDNISGIAWSKDRAIVLTWSDKSVQFWRVADGTELGHLAHDDIVVGAALSHDGSMIVSWTTRHVVHVWRAADAVRVTQVMHGDRVERATFSSNGERVVSCSADGTAKVWKSAEHAGSSNLVTLHHQSPVRRAIFTTDDASVWTTSADGQMRLWAIDNGRPLAQLRHDGAVLALVSAHGSSMLSCSADGTAIHWDLLPADGPIVVTHDDLIEDALFNGDGLLLATRSADRTVRVWDAENGRQVAMLTFEHPVTGAAFVADDSSLVAWNDSEVRQWDASRNQEIRIEGIVGPVRNVHCALHSPWVLASGDAGVVWAWKTSAPREVIALSHPTPEGEAGLASEGDFGVTFSTDGRCCLWDLPRGALRWQGQGPHAPIAARIANRGSHLVVWSSTELNAWELESSEPPIQLHLPGEILAISREEPLLMMTASEKFSAITISMVSGSAPFPPLKLRDEISAATFFAANRRAVIQSTHWTSVCDLVEGRVIYEIARVPSTRGVEVSADEQRMMGSSTVLDTTTGDSLAIAPVTFERTRFSRDARRMVEWKPASWARLWPMWQPPNEAAAYATSVVAKLNSLSPQDKRAAYIELGDDAAMTMSAERFATLNDRTMFEAPEGRALVSEDPEGNIDTSDGSDRAASDANVKIELVVNDRGEAFVFHSRPFSSPLRRLYFRESDAALWFVLRDTVRDFGIPVDTRMVQNLRHADRMLVVLMDAKTGEPIEGTYYPLIVL